jgi:hypothetical protein
MSAVSFGFDFLNGFFGLSGWGHAGGEVLRSNENYPSAKGASSIILEATIPNFRRFSRGGCVSSALARGSPWNEPNCSGGSERRSECEEVLTAVEPD